VSDPVPGSSLDETVLATRWLREPDFWEETKVIEHDDLRIVFHLVAVRSTLKTWCGYLGYPKLLTLTAEQENVVDACAHAGEITGHLSPANGYVPRWPGYAYPGFDCAHVGDWTPDDRVSLDRNPVNYRTLDYVRACLYAMAEALAQRVDPAQATMLRRAGAEADVEEDRKIPYGP